MYFNPSFPTRLRDFLGIFDLFLGPFNVIFQLLAVADFGGVDRQAVIGVDGGGIAVAASPWGSLVATEAHETAVRRLSTGRTHFGTIAHGTSLNQQISRDTFLF